MSDHRLNIRVQAPSEIKTYLLDATEPIWIGRALDCALTLDANNISRRHISLQHTNEGILVTDTSSNGTLVQGLPLRSASRILSEKTLTLIIGHFELYVTASPEPQESLAADLPSPNPAIHQSTPSEATSQSSEQGFIDPPRRRFIHRQLLNQLELPSVSRHTIDSAEMRPKVVAALRRLVIEHAPELTSPAEQEDLVRELTDEALGLGPLERLLADPDISEIMVVDPHTVFVERSGKMELTHLHFTDDDAVRAIIERIVTPLGRRIDESTPLVDARLLDGSRVNAVIPPLALRGPCITIRKFRKDPLRMPDLVRFGSVSPAMARFLERSVKVRKNIVISGGTGSGKTTLLNVLSASIPANERVVTVEDAAELQLAQPHVVPLEARPPNLEGKGEYSIRDLVKNALRMRPDRIIVGECRGGEAIDMLQAMNTGHEGSMSTTHANSPKEAITRLETLCLMAGLDLPVRAIRQQIAASVHLLVQQSRFSDGSRRITNISEIVGMTDEGEVDLREIFAFHSHSAELGHSIEGEFLASGYLPTFLDQFITAKLIDDGEYL